MRKVEEVARAIAWANNEDDFGRMSDEVQKLYREQARAAITAMRPLMERLAEASPGDARLILAEEIDAALTEPVSAVSPTATHESLGG